MRPAAAATILLTAALGLSGCTCHRRTSDLRVVATDPTSQDATPRTVVRCVLLGKVVDLRAHAVEHALLDEAPRMQAADDATAFLIDSKNVLHAFDLGTGHELWRATVDPPCDHIFNDSDHAYCTAREKVFAFARDGGTTKLLFTATSQITSAFVASGLLAVADFDGHVTTIDPRTGGVLGARDMHPTGIARSPTDTGICVTEIHSSTSTVSTVAECVDMRLSPIWSKSFPTPSREWENFITRDYPCSARTNEPKRVRRSRRT